MFDVTVSGETIVEVVEQMQMFIAMVLPAASTVGNTIVEKVSGKKSKAKATLEIVPEPAVGVGTAEPNAVREIALDKLRTLYSSGKEGAVAVRAISAHFGVKKLGDVPLDRADELLRMVEAVS